MIILQAGKLSLHTVTHLNTTMRLMDCEVRFETSDSSGLQAQLGKWAHTSILLCYSIP